MGDRIVLAIEELEECWRRQCLERALGCTDNRMLLGSQLAGLYDRLTVQPSEQLSRFRKEWIQNTLDEFRSAWVEPTASFRAVWSDSTHAYRVANNGTEISVRNDQARQARIWRVGIEPDDFRQAVHLANSVLHASLYRLAADIRCIGRMCVAYESGYLPNADQIHWNVHSRGIAFERLIADILNEEEFCATRASLGEDLFEWTDLRVKYPGLPRKYGARVQVKLIGDECLESQQTAHRRNQEIYVILTPVRLAQYIEQCLEAGAQTWGGDDIWACFPGQPADTSELAHALSKVFERAIESNESHPLGPMLKVPSPVRRLVQGFVRTAAFSAAERMRALVNERPGAIPRWRSRFPKRR